MEHTINTSTVFSGRLLTVRRDIVALASGGRSTREVVEHPGAVAIVPVTREGNILLVEHYRYAVGRTLLELPAGTREGGEDPLQTARRELEEETGYRAGLIEELCHFFVSPGWATEEIRLFRASDLEPTGHGLDHDEILKIVEVEPERVPVLMRDGLIADAKTIIGLQSVSPYPV